MKNLKSKLVEAQAAYHAIVDTGTSVEVATAARAVKEARAAVAAALVSGAAPCPKCGAKPHGMYQPQELKPAVAALVLKSVPGIEPCEGGIVAVEIGCTTCKHHRARGFTAAMALEAWNAGAAAYTGISATIDARGEGAIAGLPEAWHCPARVVRV